MTFPIDKTDEWESRQDAKSMISEVRPNPGNENGKQCSICGAVLVCLSCGNHRDERYAQLEAENAALRECLTEVGKPVTNIERAKFCLNYQEELEKYRLYWEAGLNELLVIRTKRTAPPMSERSAGE